MGVVGALRELWRMRRPVVAVAACALLIGLATAYRIGLPPSLASRQYEVGVASARALVDTPSSQVVDLGLTTGGDIGTLSARANLLASLITTSPMKEEIATRAGIDPRLLVTPPTSSGPSGATSGGSASTGAISAGDPRASVLRASVPSLEAGTIPIIAVDTQAPDAVRAGRLADQAIAVLQSHLQSVAGTERVPAQRRVVVRELGAAASSTVRRGPSHLLALFAAFGVFVLGCGGILATSAVLRDWRRTSGEDSAQGDSAPEPEPVGEAEAVRPEVPGLDRVRESKRVKQGRERAADALRAYEKT